LKTSTRTFIVLVISLVGVVACEALGGPELASDAGVNALRIPALIDSRTTPEIVLVMQNGAHEFYEGIPSVTRGFNGDYLGPTIRLYDDSDTTITFLNEIGEPTTVHGHGLHVSGEIDGGPQSRIQPGESWTITIPVRQQAGTSWYHPHLMGKTAEHVHSGLAGVYLIEDANSLALDLPREYGVNDIPLVIQDRSFTEGKMNEYAVEQRQLFIDGLREDTVVVNGTLNAYHAVPQGWVRLRLLNGSNSRFYRFSFDDGASFYKIATEGGFLNQPVQMESIQMAPGERNEIMVDLSDGANATLIADLLPVDPGERGFLQRDPRVHVVELRVDSTLEASGTLPEILNDIAYFDRTEAMQTRVFDLQMDGNNRQDWTLADHKTMFSINGQSMDMSVINERVEMGAVEIWRVTAERMPHPFHIHGVSFQILSVGGEPPAEEDRGWKDTVVVTREPTELIMRFDHEASQEYPLMYHCHMLEHEEGGMMGQFTVE
jgi:bilirubin oxidase